MRFVEEKIQDTASGKTPQQVVKIKLLIEKIKALIELGIDKIDTYKIAEEVVIVVGHTGHGKSTLINYLAGAKLRGVIDSSKYMVIEADEHVGDIEIVTGETSGTTVPNQFFDEKTGITYFDCPGFEDTRGVEQDIANGFYIKRIFDLAKKIKVIIVAETSSLLQRSKEFLNTTKELHKLFYGLQKTNEHKKYDSSFSLIESENSQNIGPNIVRKLEDSFILVVSNAKEEFKANDAKERLAKISKAENAKDLSYQGLKTEGSFFQKEIIDHLASDKGRVAIFHTPKQIGELDGQESKIILEQIQAAPYIKKPNAYIVVSNESKEILQFWSDEITQSVVSRMQEVGVLLQTKYAIENEESKEVEELKKILENLKSSIRHLIKHLNSSLNPVLEKALEESFEESSIEKSEESILAISEENVEDIFEQDGINPRVIEQLIKTLMSINNISARADLAKNVRNDLEYIEFMKKIGIDCKKVQITITVTYHKLLNTATNFANAIKTEIKDRELEAIKEQHSILEQKTIVLEDKTQSLEKKTVVLENKTKLLEEEKNLLKDQTQFLEQKNNQLDSKAQSLEEETKVLKVQTKALEEQGECLKKENQQLKNRPPEVHNHYNTYKSGGCNILKVTNIEYYNKFLNLKLKIQKDFIKKLDIPLWDTAVELVHDNPDVLQEYLSHNIGDLARNDSYNN